MKKEKSEKNLYLRLVRIIFLIIFLVFIWTILPKLFAEDENFLAIIGGCTNFTVSGIITNENDQFYLSRITYCGGNEPTEFSGIEGRLYDNRTRIGFENIQRENGLRLEEFLYEMKFKIDDLSSICQDLSNLSLEVVATQKDNRTTFFEVALTSEIVC